MSELILASGSAIRRKVLADAGLAFAVQRPALDETAAKQALRARGLKPAAQALALAEAKALDVSRVRAGYALGCDQMLALGDEAFDKPADRDAARAQLRRLRGKTHHLLCAAAIARDGEILWRHIETPALTMRPFGDSFLEAYLDRAGPGVLATVGAYEFEGLGAQLFERVEGDYFAVLGVPLLPLLAFLRAHGLAAT